MASWIGVGAGSGSGAVVGALLAAAAAAADRTPRVGRRHGVTHDGSPPDSRGRSAGVRSSLHRELPFISLTRPTFGRRSNITLPVIEVKLLVFLLPIVNILSLI
jgi:hypothetical protein